MVSPAEQGDPVAEWSADIGALAVDVDRVSGRLRGLTEARLGRPLPPYGTVADAGHTLAQALADAGRGVEERRAGGCPPRRTLPELRPAAVGDQVAVTGHDLVLALADSGPADPVWTVEGRVSAADLLASTRRLTRAVKLAID